MSENQMIDTKLAGNGRLKAHFLKMNGDTVMTNYNEIAYDMLDIKRALDRCSINQLIEEREYVKNNTEPSTLKTATLGEIDRQIKERRG